MARNKEKDIVEEKRRRAQLLEAGFELFSEKGIDNVSLQAVADKAQVGVATVYNYYSTKVNLLVAISAEYWGDFWRSCYANNPELAENLNAYELIERYNHYIIELYHENPKLLRFSSDYKTVICRSNCSDADVNVQLNALKPLQDRFAQRYEEAKKNGCIRTDIPCDEMFTTAAMTMLSMAERYSLGLVWAHNSDNDYTKELEHVSDMLLMWVKGE